MCALSEITPIVDLLSNFGFPIFFCILIYVDLRKKLDDLIKEVRKLNEH